MKYSLEDILSATLETLEISPSFWEAMRKYRVADTIKVKRFVSAIAHRFGYKHIEIAHFLHNNRTTIIHHIKTFNDQAVLYEELRTAMQSIVVRLAKRKPMCSGHVSHAWMARTKSGVLVISPVKPERVGAWWIAEGSRLFNPQDAFPQITYESEPMKVRIEITIESNE